MRRHFVSGFPRALLSLSQEKSSGVEIVAVYCCNFDDKKIISGGSDGLIKIWDAYTGDNTVSFAGHKGEVVRTRVNRATPAKQPF